MFIRSSMSLELKKVFQVVMLHSCITMVISEMVHYLDIGLFWALP